MKALGGRGQSLKLSTSWTAKESFLDGHVPANVLLLAPVRKWVGRGSKGKDDSPRVICPEMQRTSVKDGRKHQRAVLNDACLKLVKKTV